MDNSNLPAVSGDQTAEDGDVLDSITRLRMEVFAWVGYAFAIQVKKDIFIHDSDF